MFGYAASRKIKTGMVMGKMLDRARQIARDLMLVTITIGIVLAGIAEIKQRNEAKTQAQRILEAERSDEEKIKDALGALRWYQDDESVELKDRLRARLRRGWLRF